MSIGAVLAAARTVYNQFSKVVNTPNYVESNNAFVRSEQAKNISYRYRI